MRKIYIFICILFVSVYAHSQNLPQTEAFVENKGPLMEVNISPNPTRGDFVVEVNSVDFITAQISLYNMLGKQLSVRAIELETGPNNFSYAGTGLFPGNYFVSVKTNKGSIVKKVTIE